MTIPQGFYPAQYDPTLGPLAGMTTEQLQAALATAQQAYVEFQTGGKIVEATYAQGDGTKTVIYQKTDVATLYAFILALQAALGVSCGPRRRPIRPLYV